MRALVIIIPIVVAGGIATWLINAALKRALILDEGDENLFPPQRKETDANDAGKNKRLRSCSASLHRTSRAR